MYSINPNDFKFPKPIQWRYMPLYEKISYYKNQLGPEFAKYVDKLNVKNIIQELCGDSVKVAPLVRILASPTDFTQADLDTANIIKSSHGSGWNISITDTTTVEEVTTKLKSWNKPYIGDVTGESQYQYIKPQFYIEQKIDDPKTGKTGNALVYMFRCIHGNPTTFGIRYGNTQNNYYVSDKAPLSPVNFQFEFPPQYEEMLLWAKRLSAPFEFVRIDFHLSAEGIIYFSEFTFTPSGGSILFPYRVEKALGKLW
jgi:hypothetical protein